MINKQNLISLAVFVLMVAFSIPVSKAGEQSGIDIAIGDKDLVVTKLSDQLFEALIVISNKGSVPLPRFSVYFYAGDPDKGGRLLSHRSQSAGPIMPSPDNS